MRVVVDANVLIRALIKPDGTVGPVLKRLRRQNYLFVYSRPMLDELLNKLMLPRIRVKYHLDPDVIQTLLEVIARNGMYVEPTGRISVCRDVKDNMILEAAIAGRADCIVSTDEDLIVLSPYEGIPVVSPAQFLRKLEGH